MLTVCNLLLFFSLPSHRKMSSRTTSECGLVFNTRQLFKTKKYPSLLTDSGRHNKGIRKKWKICDFHCASRCYNILYNSFKKLISNISEFWAPFRGVATCTHGTHVRTLKVKKNKIIANLLSEKSTLL